MKNTINLAFAVFVQTLRRLSSQPLGLALLSLPAALCDLALESLADTQTQPNYVVIFASFLGAWILTRMGALATFEVASRSPGEVTVAQAFGSALRKLRLLVPVELLTGIWVILGILLVLPGIYFLTVFAFVPFLIAESKESKPWLNYLIYSRALAKPVFWPLLLLTTVFFLLSLLSTLGDSGGWALKLLATIVLTAVANVSTVFFYQRVKETLSR